MRGCRARTVAGSQGDCDFLVTLPRQTGNGWDSLTTAAYSRFAKAESHTLAGTKAIGVRSHAVRKTTMTNVKGQFKPWQSPRWLLTINGLRAWGWLGVGGPAIAQPDGATMPDAIRMSDTVTYSVRPSDNGAHATAVAPAVLEPVSSGFVVADIAIGGSASGGSASGGSASGGSGANHPGADDDVPVLAQLDGPVTSVSDLTDVDPTHWAFSALRSLVERYGCISGYGDRTFRGDQSLSRYEFAAALNACLDQIGAQIEAAVQDGVDNGDLATVRRLQQEFQQELAD